MSPYHLGVPMALTGGEKGCMLHPGLHSSFSTQHLARNVFSHILIYKLMLVAVRNGWLDTGAEYKDDVCQNWNEHNP